MQQLQQQAKKQNNSTLISVIYSESQLQQQPFMEGKRKWSLLVSIQGQTKAHFLEIVPDVPSIPIESTGLTKPCPQCRPFRVQTGHFRQEERGSSLAATPTKSTFLLA